MENGAETVRVSGRVLLLLPSLTATVKLLVPGCAGVPETCPLAVSDNPPGSDPEVTDQE